MARSINNLVTKSDDYIGIDSKESIEKCLNCDKEECTNCLNGSSTGSRKGGLGKPKIDMTGKRIGNWTVIGPAPSRSGDGAAYWLCKCDCGTVSSVVGRSLRSVISKRCRKCANERKKKGGADCVSAD